jgi:acyl-CoA reductase-like NAD-dependent aldehyde dehydrogenase
MSVARVQAYLHVAHVRANHPAFFSGQPFHNLLSPVMAALMSGNAIVVKTSESVSWSSYHFSQAIRSCLESCGHDPDTVQVLIGCEAVATSEGLSKNPEIKHLTFIGSDIVGKMIAKDAAECLTPVTLELGGKVSRLSYEYVDISSARKLTKHCLDCSPYRILRYC